MNFAPRPHGARYPWKSWFSRRKVVLVHGTDFLCRPDAFVAMVRQRARQYRSQNSFHVTLNADMKTVIIERFRRNGRAT